MMITMMMMMLVGIPSSLGVLPIIRRYGIAVLPAAYVGNNSRHLPPIPVSLSWFTAAQVARPKFHSAAAGYKLGKFQRLGAGPIVACAVMMM